MEALFMNNEKKDKGIREVLKTINETLKIVVIQNKILVSVDEAAILLTTSVPTIREMLKSGSLKYLEIRGVKKLYVKELHQFSNTMLGKNIDPYSADGQYVKDLR